MEEKPKEKDKKAGKGKKAGMDLMHESDFADIGQEEPAKEGGNADEIEDPDAEKKADAKEDDDMDFLQDLEADVKKKEPEKKSKF